MRSMTWAALVFVTACATGARSESGSAAACRRVREARARIGDVPSGVELDLLVDGSELEVRTLQDYVRHLVNAWNEAEQGIAQRCYPRLQTGAASDPLVSTAELAPMPDGVRVTFKPIDPAQLDALRAHVHRQESHTLSCACEPRPQHDPHP